MSKTIEQRAEEKAKGWSDKAIRWAVTKELVQFESGNREWTIYGCYRRKWLRHSTRRWLIKEWIADKWENTRSSLLVAVIASDLVLGTRKRPPQRSCKSIDYMPLCLFCVFFYRKGLILFKICSLIEYKWLHLHTKKYNYGNIIIKTNISEILRESLQKNTECSCKGEPFGIELDPNGSIFFPGWTGGICT